MYYLPTGVYSKIKTNILWKHQAEGLFAGPPGKYYYSALAIVLQFGEISENMKIVTKRVTVRCFWDPTDDFWLSRPRPTRSRRQTPKSRYFWRKMKG